MEWILCGNGIEVHQVQTGRTQPDRQDEEWSMPANVERREMIQRGIVIQEHLLLLLPSHRG